MGRDHEILRRYSRLAWTAASVVALVIFLGLLTQALKVLPLGTAYAVWTGIGAVGSVAAGLLLFGEAPRASPPSWSSSAAWWR